MTVTQVDDVGRETAAPLSPASTGWLVGCGATFGLGALISSSCCALPILLASLGAGSAVFSALELLTHWRPYFLGGGMLALLGGWVLFFRRATVVCSPDGACTASASSPRAIVLLGVGTIFVALSLMWDVFFETILLRMVR